MPLTPAPCKERKERGTLQILLVPSMRERKGRATRPKPTHRKVRDEWGTRLNPKVWGELARGVPLSMNTIRAGYLDGHPDARFRFREAPDEEDEEEDEGDSKDGNDNDNDDDGYSE
jgi:hypothetical protein